MALARLVETATITSKGQTTVPKSIRQVLGLDVGGTVQFAVEGDSVILRRAEPDHEDPALGAFLALLEKDIQSGKNIYALPPELEAAFQMLADRADHDIDAPLEGDVEL